MKFCNSRISILLVIISIIVASLSFLMGVAYGIKNVEIYYISRKEIIELENHRIENIPWTSKELFFSKPAKAVDYIEEIWKRMNSNRKIVLLTEGDIYGDKAISISKKVHQEIIDRLNQYKK